MSRKIMCEVSEKAVCVVNKCIDKNISINTSKLHQLMILIHGTMLSKYQTPFFQENVYATDMRLVVKELEQDCLSQKISFEERMQEYICLLQREEQVIDAIIEKYAGADFLEIGKEKVLRQLREFCYDEENKTNEIVPNELIEKVFDYYAFSDLNVVQKKLSKF